MTDMSLAAASTPATAATGRARLLILLGALYFTQGLPMGLSMEALPVLMRQNGVPLEMIALVPLAGLPWILKLFWAPMVDNRWGPRLGRRRSWIIPMQAVLALTLSVTAFLPLSGPNIWIAVLMLAVGAIASATQDTATDGLAAEQLTGSGLAYANALQIGGMMAGFMVGGGGTLLMADPLGQMGTFLVLALFPAATVLIALAWREPPRVKSAPGDTPARLISTFRRQGIWTLLILAFIYGGAHAGGLSVSKIFLVDLGWSNSGTGTISTISGFVMLILGCPLGSYLTIASRWRAMSIGMLLAATAFLFWGLIAGGMLAASWVNVVLAISLLSIASGVIAVSAATILMAFGAGGNQAGTDITVLQSANVLGEMVIAGLVVWIAGQSGYAMTFGGAAVALLIVAFGVSRMSRRAAAA